MSILDLSILDNILLSGTPPANGPRCHLMLLNWELVPSTTLLRLLRAASSITCADGGANRLLERLWEFDLPTCTDVFYEKSGVKKPLYIVGDCDSISPSVADGANSESPACQQLIDLGFQLVKIVDPYNTDFEKSVLHIEQEGIIKAGDVLLVDGAFGGRFDQTTAIVATLLRLTHLDPDIRQEFCPKRHPAAPVTSADYQTILLGNQSACALLPVGHTIVKPARGCATHVCSLLPFIPVKSVTTTGLRWDLSDWSSAMNGLVGTSNELVGEEVEIHTSEPIMWYSQLKPF